MKRTTLFIHAELEHDLKRLASRDGRSTASVVREALVEYCAARLKEPAPRPRFIAMGRSGHRTTAASHEDLLWTGVDPHADEARSAPAPRSPAASRRRGGR
jgi:hypothetical protein